MDNNKYREFTDAEINMLWHSLSEASYNIRSSGVYDVSEKETHKKLGEEIEAERKRRELNNG